jgi:hypothetical protein
LSRTTDFIAKLIKAANTPDQQTEFEKKCLLDNALAIIQHMRGLLRYRTSKTSDALLHLQSISTAITIGWATDAQVKLALLDAARMIRELNVEVDRRVRSASLPPTGFEQCPSHNYNV